jgi:hypothetical protein
MPPNFYLGDQNEDYWVWVNPSNFLVRHHITTVGCFVSAGSVQRGDSNLPFIPNPKFSGDISPFTIGVTQQYRAEYNLEINREHYFPLYPSRLNAIYLLRTEDDALCYQELHPDHVTGRVLKRVRAVGEHAHSTHDSSWIDFLRLWHSCDDETIHGVAQAYWGGARVEDNQLKSMGKPWAQKSVSEVLYLGRIDFYDRTLPAA